jgi:hypothetical protein
VVYELIAIFSKMDCSDDERLGDPPGWTAAKARLRVMLRRDGERWKVYMREDRCRACFGTSLSGSLLRCSQPQCEFRVHHVCALEKGRETRMSSITTGTIKIGSRGNGA